MNKGRGALWAPQSDDMKLIIASNNAHKIYEIKKILAGKFDEIVSLREAGISHETVEDGKTFIENALKKAREISQISGCASLADDSGICVNALGGAPGIYSARFAGEYVGQQSDDANNALLLKNLEGKSNRKARFRTVIALILGGKEYLFEGKVEGAIIDHMSGTKGFGYDPMFVPEGDTRTFAEMSADEKNAISHRGRAVAKLVEFLQTEI